MEINDLLTSKKFKDLLEQALLDSRLDIAKFQNELKKQYKKAWGSSDWLDKRLAREYTKFIVDNMIAAIQEEVDA